MSSTWEDLTTRFLAQFFPSGRTAKLLPHHGIDLWLQVQIFYDHVNPVTRRTIDQSAGGKLRDRNAKESWALLEDLALYDNESWNDPRDFAKSVKAITFPQDVLSTSDCLLIKLENQVQCLMEAHLAPTFMASKDARLSKFEADFKQQQGEMNNKINTVLKAIIDRIAGTLPSDTVKNPKLRYNKDDKGIEWLDVKEPLDLVDTSEELVYESLNKEMPKCSLNYDFRIKKGDPRNHKTPCMKRHKFIANAYIDVDLPMNIMSLAYYNSIRKNGYEYRGINFIGLGRDMQDLEMSELSSKGHDLLSSRVILYEDDYDRGCRKPSDLEDGFYRDTIKLGPEYATEMDDEGEVTGLAFGGNTRDLDSFGEETDKTTDYNTKNHEDLSSKPGEGHRQP
ncbi:hypothetical protein Tco_1304430 [Tanacetum coccineum]